MADALRLYPHQTEAVEWLATGDTRKALCDDPGLGKTISAICAARRVEARRVLVVCPTSLLWNWKAELAAWWPEALTQVVDTGSRPLDPAARVVITTHGLLLARQLRSTIVAQQWDVVILDESHFLRGPTAKRARAFYLEVEPRAKRVWALSATPMPNDASNLWTMCFGLWPDRFPYGFEGFRDHYCVTAWSPYGDGVKVVGNRNVEELRAKLAPVLLRRRKADVLDLPPVRYEIVALKPDRRPTEFEELDDVLAKLTRRKLTPDERVLHPGCDTVGDVIAASDDPEAAFKAAGAFEHFSRWRRVCGIAKASAVAELLTVELDSGLDRVVVMAHHTDVVDSIALALKDYGAVTITGATPATQRQANVDAFQAPGSGVRVLVANIVAGGTGLTLTAAADLVFAEMSYVPAENVQAADRIHRIGQTRGCRVRFVSLAGTLDESLVGVLRRKSEMIREAMEK